MIGCSAKAEVWLYNFFFQLVSLSTFLLKTIEVIMPKQRPKITKASPSSGDVNNQPSSSKSSAAASPSGGKAKSDLVYQDIAGDSPRTVALGYGEVSEDSGTVESKAHDTDGITICFERKWRWDFVVRNLVTL